MRLDADELRAIVAAGEGKTTELKRGLQRDATLARTLAAFANTRGGYLIVGVGDKREIVGAPHPRQTAHKLAEIAQRHVDPPLAVEVVLVELEGKPIVCCSVPLSPARPHAAVDEHGGRSVLVRNGSSNRVASAAVLARIGPASPARLGEIEQRVLDWIDAAHGGTETTARAFADAAGVGIQRSRRACRALEEAGLLVGHGSRNRRVFSRP